MSLIAVFGLVAAWIQVGPFCAYHQASVKPIQEWAASCESAPIIGISSNGKRVICFDHWSVKQIAFEKHNRSILLPVPPSLRTCRIYTAVQVDNQNWWLAVGRPGLAGAGELENRLVLFDFATNTIKADYPGHADMDANLLFASKRSLIIENTVLGYKIWFWDAKTGKKMREIDLLQELHLQEPSWQEKNQKHFALSTNSSFLAVGLDAGLLEVLDIEKMAWNEIVPKKEGRRLGSLTFVGDDIVAGVWYESTGKEFLEVYNLKSRKLIFRKECGGRLSEIMASPDGGVLVLTNEDFDKNENRICFINMQTKRESFATFKVSSGPSLISCTFTQNGETLVTCDSEKIRIWDVALIMKEGQ